MLCYILSIAEHPVVVRIFCECSLDCIDRTIYVGFCHTGDFDGHGGLCLLQTERRAHAVEA